ncbi:MAG TPA: hypothetical protein VMY18_05930 [Acidobacteriota bacterium]|nr:hypothetical protein [Acidobacteriota bacterium]
MTRRISVPMLSFLLIVSLGGSLIAQDSETIYTRVGFWEVPRTKWKAFGEFFEKFEKPVLDKALSEGLIEEYGIDAISLHDPDGYTHTTWFSASTMAGLENVLDAFEAAAEARSTSGNNVNNEFAGMVTKHRDSILRSISHGAKPVKLDDGYFFGTMTRVKRGKGRDYNKTWEAFVKPVYEQLLADGTIVSYGLDTAFIHTEKPGDRMSWYIISNMEADEKVEAAFDASWDKLSETEREARRALFWELTEEGSHRDEMTRIIHYAHK